MNKLVEQYIDLDEKERVIHDKKMDIAQRYAEETCPFKVGDTVEIKGYSHNGKKGVVNAIIPCMHTWNRDDKENCIIWKVYGTVLRSDGSLGRHGFDFDKEQYGSNK